MKARKSLASAATKRRKLPAGGKSFSLPESRKFDSLIVTHLPNIRFLTGFTGSSGCVLITPRKRFFFTDFRYREQAANEVKDFEVHITPGAALDGCCRYIIARRLKTGVIGFEGNQISLREHKLLRKLLKGSRFFDASGEVEKQRRIKSRQEITHLRRACAIADAAYKKLARSKVIGKSEKEIAWMLESTMRQAGSGPMPFEIIVASGPRSAMPHGAASGRIIGKGELVVVDLGATVAGYCSDATRTFATGPLKPKQEKIYQVVEAAQQMALEDVAAGMSCAEIDKIARDHIAAAGFGKAFGHSLGHGVGLEAHEGPVLSPKSKEVLESGMTVTIEPGIYLEGIGGVRIEDTVLVNARGAERLTKFPRGLTSLK